MSCALRGGKGDGIAGKSGGVPVDRCKPVSTRPTPCGLAFVRSCLSHQAATTGVMPYLFLLSALLGTVLSFSVCLQNE